jgi:hypothetical protein
MGDYVPDRGRSHRRTFDRAVPDRGDRCAGRPPGGMQVALRSGMSAPLNWPGPDFVHTEVTSLGLDGPFRLTVLHARGTIVEYFVDTASALSRQGELEALLAAARGFNPMPLRRAV